MKVLVVEDHEDISRGLKLLLEAYGHSALVAGTVAEGIEHLADSPSHVLLDINLPDGLGTIIARRIRHERMPIKIAVLSGSEDADVLAEMNSLAPEATFAKPTNWGAVMRWLD